MLSVPPKLSAAPIFWLGIGLSALHLLTEWLLYGQAVGLNLPSVALLIVGFAGQLGIGLIVASVIVKALSPQHAPHPSREAAHQEGDL